MATVRLKGQQNSLHKWWHRGEDTWLVPSTLAFPLADFPSHLTQFPISWREIPADLIKSLQVSYANKVFPPIFKQNKMELVGISPINPDNFLWIWISTGRDSVMQTPQWMKCLIGHCQIRFTVFSCFLFFLLWHLKPQGVSSRDILYVTYATHISFVF